MLNGGRLLVCAPEMLSLEDLGRNIESSGVTVLFLTTGIFHHLTGEHLEKLRGVRRLLTGGDVVNPQHMKYVRNTLPGTQLIAAYGPTENTTFTTCYEVGADDASLASSVPIGAPISSTQVYVLDVYMHPVPIGVVGELYTSGEGLARGYLNNPDLTAQKFLPNPFSKKPGDRLYRTGDNARWLENGNLEFAGRIDQQVKIRGFRVEPGEIEGILGGYAGVGSVAVIAREDNPGEKRLVAYVAPRPGHSFSPDILRAHVARSLPDFMVPAAFVVLDALPLTANGKVDRKALPAPDFTASTAGKPRTPQEEILCALIAEILRVPHVGPQDNFFNRGGDSILSIQLVSRMRRKGWVITPRDVFERQTVEGLAAVARPLHETAAAPDIAIGAVPLTPIMHWFRERGASVARFSQSMLLQVPAELGQEPIVRALQSLLDRHDALRLQLTIADDGQWSMNIPSPGSVQAASCFLKIDISQLDEAASRSVILAGSQGR